MIEFQYPGNFEKNHSVFWWKFEAGNNFLSYICKLQWLLCYYLLSFVWKRDHDRAVWHEKVSAHNGAKFFIKSQSCIDNLKAQQNMLYRAAKVDFWQAIPPLWQPHQRAATATAGFYFTKSMQSSRSYLLWRPSIILLRRLKVAILKFSLMYLINNVHVAASGIQLLIPLIYLLID